MKITYEIYSRILNKTYQNTKRVNSMSEWDLFNMAVYHGNAVIVSIAQ